jgi:hypothetical protein
MPAHTAAYQRILVKGIPVWKDKEGSLYYYESSVQPTEQTRIKIGSESTGLSSDCMELLQSKLESYRQTMVSRTRLVAAPAEKK